MDLIRKVDSILEASTKSKATITGTRMATAKEKASFTASEASAKSRQIGEDGFKIAKNYFINKTFKSFKVNKQLLKGVIYDKEQFGKVDIMIPINHNGKDIEVPFQIKATNSQTNVISGSLFRTTYKNMFSTFSEIVNTPEKQTAVKKVFNRISSLLFDKTFDSSTQQPDEGEKIKGILDKFLSYESDPAAIANNVLNNAEIMKEKINKFFSEIDKLSSLTVMVESHQEKYGKLMALGNVDANLKKILDAIVARKEATIKKVRKLKGNNMMAFIRDVNKKYKVQLKDITDFNFFFQDKVERILGNFYSRRGGRIKFQDLVNKDMDKVYSALYPDVSKMPQPGQERVDDVLSRINKKKLDFLKKLVYGSKDTYVENYIFIFKALTNKPKVIIVNQKTIMDDLRNADFRISKSGTTLEINGNIFRIAIQIKSSKEPDLQAKISTSLSRLESIRNTFFDTI